MLGLRRVGSRVIIIIIIIAFVVLLDSDNE